MNTVSGKKRWTLNCGWHPGSLEGGEAGVQIQIQWLPHNKVTCFVSFTSLDVKIRSQRFEYCFQIPFLHKRLNYRRKNEQRLVTTTALHHNCHAIKRCLHQSITGLRKSFQTRLNCGGAKSINKVWHVTKGEKSSLSLASKPLLSQATQPARYTFWNNSRFV